MDLEELIISLTFPVDTLKRKTQSKAGAILFRRNTADWMV